MKVSEQWLREWVNPQADTQQLIETLSMAGLEAESCGPVAPAFSGVVVGDIVTCCPHPDARKLQIAEVSTGQQTFQVVCGAANARPGIKVPFALPGARLPGSINIEETTLRGVRSSGMLCGADELGLAGEKSDGLMELDCGSPTGTDIRTALSLDDTVINIDLTPNRGDCLSIAGIAREVSALFGTPANQPEEPTVAPTINDTCTVKVACPKGCPRYLARIVRDVSVQVRTPDWMAQRLHRAGLRLVDPVSDITQYVMLELGQPLHGYDLDRIGSGLEVRYAQPAETVELLDGSQQTLQDNTLVVANDEQVLCIAGVMGGAKSGIGAQTRNVVLESAFFDRIALAGQARRYGLHSDAANRFERGVDFHLQRKAMERATALIVAVCGGEPGPVTEVVSEQELPILQTITFHHRQIGETLGIDIPASRITEILTSLGLGVEALASDRWSVSIPGWRFDLSGAEDLVEEVGRVYGYDQLPETPLRSSLQMAHLPEQRLTTAGMGRILMARGYHEAINFSFIDPALHALFDRDDNAQVLSNPISSEMAVMRTSLLPGLVNAARYNINRQQSRVRLFERGQTFRQCKGELTQSEWLGGVLYGQRYPESCHDPRDSVDFFDIKGDLQAIIASTGQGQRYHFEQDEQHPALHSGQSARIMLDQQRVGIMGALHPRVARHLGITGPLYLFEIAVDSLIHAEVPILQELSCFPELRRDLALLVHQSVPASAIESVIRSHAGDWLQQVRIFDLYTGAGVDEGLKSIAVGMTLCSHEQTLQEEEINGVMTDVMRALTEQTGAVLRH